MTSYACQGCGKPLVKSWKGRSPKWCSERCRKRQYAGTCIDCGNPTNGYDGPSQASERCIPCRKKFTENSLTFRHECSERLIGRVTWTDAQILDALRLTAVDGVVTKPHYEEVRAQSEQPMPSVPIIIRRHGTWVAAITAAGLRASTRGNRGPRCDRANDETLLAAVRACMIDLGHLPSVVDYDAWSPGRNVRSSTTIRNRFGSWTSVLDRVTAAQRVAA